MSVKNLPQHVDMFDQTLYVGDKVIYAVFDPWVRYKSQATKLEAGYIVSVTESEVIVGEVKPFGPSAKASWSEKITNPEERIVKLEEENGRLSIITH